MLQVPQREAVLWGQRSATVWHLIPNLSCDAALPQAPHQTPRSLKDGPDLDPPAAEHSQLTGGAGQLGGAWLGPRATVQTLEKEGEGRTSLDRVVTPLSSPSYLKNLLPDCYCDRNGTLS